MRKLINSILLFSIGSLAFAQSLNSGQIGNSQSVCYGSSPSFLLFTTIPSGGTMPYTYRWQRSNDGGSNWYDVTGSTASRQTYSPPVLGRTTLFRCRVTDATMVSVTTNPVTITVLANLAAGTIGNSQTVYMNTHPTPITQINAPSGGAGSFSFRWQSSSDGLYWSNIPDATSLGYSPTNLTTDTWFRRFVIDASCGSTASNSVKMTITTNPLTLYSSEIPQLSFSDANYDLGTEFETLSDGIIKAVRLYSHINEGGTHQVRIWRRNSQSTYELLAGPFNWNFPAGSTGWRVFELPSAISVEAGHIYIVSISTGANNTWWMQSNNFVPYITNNYVRYIRGLLSGTLGLVPNLDYGAGYFRDIIFFPFSSGSAGESQSICYNTIPEPLTETIPPSGGIAGTYTYQWQSSPDSITWANIEGATLPDYAAPALMANTYYRRRVTSGDLTSYCPPVLITVDAQFNLAQIHDNITILENSSTYLNIEITGGTPPYAIEYTRNGVTQNPIINYTSGNGIYTGVLGSGTYTYSLTSVTDSFGCEVQSRGNPITVTASGTHSGTGSNKVLVIVNSQNIVNYSDYDIYIRPYLDWFGLPYDTCNISTMSLPDFGDYALIIFGHRNVYASGYPIDDLEAAIYSGVGLYSLDPHLFDFPSAFNTSGATHPAVTSSQIYVLTDHYITNLHTADTFHPTNNIITLNEYGAVQQTITVSQTNYSLGGTNPTILASVSNGVSTEPLLQITSYGSGKILKWSAYDWVYDYKLGPVMGMDDLIWRGIVWTAKKPFVMQGIPPMITMRVDDVDGTRALGMTDLEWLTISNEFGFIPWIGIFTESESANFFNILRDLINRNLTTASPHAFAYENLIYFNIDNAPVFSAGDSVIKASNFFINNNLTMSNYLVAHHYLLSSDALTEIRNMGIEFIGTKIPCDRTPGIDYPGEWLNCGPYRIDRYGRGGGGLPHFYADSVNWEGEAFFISLTEIGDDGGYEWYPIYDVASNTARGVRHLRRALNSMVLPVLFTHENQLEMSAEDWRLTLSGITSAISSYNPEYTSIDNANLYLRAKENIEINNVTVDNGLVSISCSGVNDMETKCYLFTESGNLISFRLITLPRVTSNSVQVTIGVSNN